MKYSIILCLLKCSMGIHVISSGTIYKWCTGLSASVWIGWDSLHVNRQAQQVGFRLFPKLTSASNPTDSRNKPEPHLLYRMGIKTLKKLHCRKFTVFSHTIHSVTKFYWTHYCAVAIIHAHVCTLVKSSIQYSLDSWFMHPLIVTEWVWESLHFDWLKSVQVVVGYTGDKKGVMFQNP